MQLFLWGGGGGAFGGGFFVGVFPRGGETPEKQPPLPARVGGGGGAGHLIVW